MTGVVTAAVIVGGSNIYVAKQAKDASKDAAASTAASAADAEALNRERWAEAQGYLDPYAGRANIAAQQLQAEMGLPQYNQQVERESGGLTEKERSSYSEGGPHEGPTAEQIENMRANIPQDYGVEGKLFPPGYYPAGYTPPGAQGAQEPINPYMDGGQTYTPKDISQIPGYQAVMDESLSAAEQSAVSSGSTAYGGRRIEAAGEVGANVQQSYYNNYMNMLQNLSSPTTATNLSSMGMNQGISMGNQNIAATNAANNYRLEGTAASNAAIADAAGGLVNLGSAYMNQPATPPPVRI